MINAQQKEIFYSYLSSSSQIDVLAFFAGEFGFVRAEVKFPVKELNGNDGKNELKKPINHQNVQHILQGIHDAVKDRFELGDPVDGLERTQHTQYTKRLDGAEIFGLGALVAEGKGHQCADHDDGVENVPQVPAVGARVEEQAQVDHFQHHFQREHSGEDKVRVGQHLVAHVVGLHGVFGGQGHAAHADDQHDEGVKVAHVHDVVADTPDPIRPTTLHMKGHIVPWSNHYILFNKFIIEFVDSIE